ncbi:hypothetical protein BXZ70DRAFT_1004195 [Cristinia sonorae]|uniref:VTT domain-containing protein n=1 Tax=Cristinia sonorae TaxID=1940300 RepID=A0A8K0UX58_9AGAR|nr:hypothetical protein BXZ70DRAFT_1004195 [Cristinia sonorae]
MASLAPPQTVTSNRHRASSTNVRPALTLNSLGSRRRSNSLLNLPPPTPSPCFSPQPSTPLPQHNNESPLSLAIPSKPSSPANNMLATLVSRALQLVHMWHSDSVPVPLTPSSPRLSRTSISSDDTLLPLSSPIKVSFNEALREKPQTSTSVRSWLQRSPSVHMPVLLVITSFPASAALVLLSAYSLPVTMEWPRNLTDLAQLGRELVGYSQSGFYPMAHVVGVISATVAWMHAWSIPGSVIMNVLAGALFSPLWATLLMTVLTTVGSIFASLLSAPLAPFLVSMFPRALAMTRVALEGSSDDSDSALPNTKSSPWIRLSILRLIGIIPWSGINIACGVCGVAVSDCFLGGFIGSLPWTAVTCQIGDILQSVASNPSPTPQTVQSVLTSPEIIAKLVFLSFLSLAPILGRDHLRALLSSSTSPESQNRGDDVQSSKWAWVKEWRSKIRMSSRERSRETTFRKELEVLVREKNESLPL